MGEYYSAQSALLLVVIFTALSRALLAISEYRRKFNGNKKNAAPLEPRLVEYIGLEPTTYRLRTYRSTR